MRYYPYIIKGLIGAKSRNAAKVKVWLLTKSLREEIDQNEVIRRENTPECYEIEVK